MIERTDFPPAPRKRRHKLSLPQLRVLKVLSEANGPLTRRKIAVRIGQNHQVYVGRAIGFSDPEKRAAFERSKEGGGRPELPNYSLLSLGYVIESEIDVDGVTETGVSITETGRQAFAEAGVDDLPPLGS